MLTPSEILKLMRVKLAKEQESLPVEKRVSLEDILERAGIDHDRLGTWERNEHYPGKRYLTAMMQAKEEFYGRVC